MNNPFQFLRDFLSRLGRQHENGRYAGRSAEMRSSVGEDSRSVFTALDIGTAYAKAMIIEVQDDIGIVLGVGRHQQILSMCSNSRPG